MGDDLNQNRQDENHNPALLIDTRCIGFHKQSKHYKLFSFDQQLEDKLEEHTYYNNCYCNEYNAMINRHFTTDLPDKFNNPDLTTVWERTNEEYIQHMQSLNMDYKMPSYMEVINNTKGSKRKRYMRAYDNIVNKRMLFDNRTSVVNFFVKIEKWPVSKIMKGKPPRGIQFRSFEYLLALKRAMTPLVELTKIDICHESGFNISKVFTKNHVPRTIAHNLFEAWNKYKNPVAVCLDHSLWDGRYCSELLEYEKKRHLRISKLNNKSLLARLLKLQFYNVGFSQGGIRYKVKGHRCSGEYTTSHGNSESNYLMIRSVCVYLNIKYFDIFVNGDDSIVICENEDGDKLSKNLRLFRNFNQLTELEIMTNTFEEISYCQCSPVIVDGSYNMIRNPTRVLSRIRYSDQNWGPCLNKFLVSLGLCELSVNMGVPILQQLAIWLIRRGGCDRPLTTVKTDHYDSQAVLEVLNIDLNTRCSFERAFGIGIEEQLNIENMLRDDHNDHPDHSDINNLLNKLNFKLY